MSRFILTEKKGAQIQIMSDDDTVNDVQSTFLENMANRQRFVSGNESDGDSDVARDDLDQLSEIGESEDVVPPETQTQAEITEKAPERAQSVVMNQAPPKLTKEQTFAAKKSCLVEIRKLRSCGAHFPRQYTFEDDLFTMQEGLELARIEITQRAKDGRNKAGVKTARRILLAGVSILEFATKKWNPLKLQMDGFGEYVMSNIDDYDNVFERLLEKYSGKGTMEPELELVIMLGTSMVMFHVSNKFVNNAMGNANIRPIDPEESRFEE